MLTDLDVANLLQAQYDNEPGTFEWRARVGEVSVAVKYYPHCTAVLFEGSYNTPDWLSNARFLPAPVENLGLVEAGFYQSMPETVEKIYTLLQPYKPVRIGGHSRGAAHANIYGRLLIKDGWPPTMMERTKFGEPKSMDHECAKGFAGSPATSYRNYISPLQQDFVCTVPFFPLSPSETPKLIAVDAPIDDPWLFLRWHHLSLYREGLKNAAA